MAILVSREAHMKRRRTLGNFLGGLAAVVASAFTLIFPLAASAGSTLYGATGSGGVLSVLYTIDKATGAGTAIGPIGFNVSGIAFDPTTGILYGLSGNREAGAPELITINPTTGAGTLVGTVTAIPGGYADITFDAAGQLYGFNEPGCDCLVRIDKATAAVTFVGPTTPSATSGLAFSNAGTLYLDGVGSLRILDPVTGAVTSTISPFSRPVAMGMDFDENDILYGLERLGNGPSGPRNLVTINTANGAVTTIGATVPGLDALAFEKNQPPVALCRNVTVSTDLGVCSAASASVDNGSSDPDGGPITLAQTPAGPYFLGSTPVTLTVTDDKGASASCEAIVTVVDTAKPVVACVPSVNPSGKNVPKANNTNEDGFYMVLTSDNCTPPVIKIGSFTLAGGETIKITQTPGMSGVRLVGTMGQPAIKHFQVGPDDAVITATDGAGNQASVTCLVPPPPK